MKTFAYYTMLAFSTLLVIASFLVPPLGKLALLAALQTASMLFDRKKELFLESLARADRIVRPLGELKKYAQTGASVPVPILLSIPNQADPALANFAVWWAIPELDRWRRVVLQPPPGQEHQRITSEKIIGWIEPLSMPAWLTPDMNRVFYAIAFVKAKTG